MAEKKTAKKTDTESFVVPIKVTNRPIIKNPTPSDSSTEVGNDVPETAPTEKVTIKPITKPDIKPLDTAPEKSEAAPKPSEEPAEAEKPTLKDVEQAELDDAAQQAEHDESIQKLIVSKKYVLPINSVEKRRSRRFVMLGIVLSLVLLVAWADVALDAGLIHVGGIKPVTHFFSN